jgi:cation transport ATPase
MKDRLDDVLNAIRISKATFLRIKLNFGWAFVYNVILVPVAMGVLYPIGFRNKIM